MISIVHEMKDEINGWPTYIRMPQLPEVMTSFLALLYMSPLTVPLDLEGKCDVRPSCV